MNPTLNNLSVNDIAELLGVSVRRVNQLENEGVIEKEKHGSYDGPACVKAYIDYSKSGSGDRARLYRAQAEAKEIEVLTTKGELLHVNILIEGLLKVFGILKRNAFGLAGRVANELASMHEPGAVRQRLLDEIRIILNEIAGELEHMAGVQLSTSSVDNGDTSTADKNNNAVGGRKPRTTTRKRRARKVPTRKNAVD